MEVGDYDIIVCGDSFCCASTLDLKLVGHRAHFSQILEDRWGYRVLNLAHGGVSNVCILWQIREAERLRPRAIVYNRTFESRIDLMLDDGFRTERGLRNWAYWEDNQTSWRTPHTNQWQNNDNGPSVLSIVPQGLAENRTLGLQDLQLSAVQSWLVYFYNSAMLQEMHDWSFEYWHKRMIEAGIQPLPLRHDKVGRAAWQFSHANPTYDTPFHTDRPTQERVAENVHSLIQSGEKLLDGWTGSWDNIN